MTRKNRTHLLYKIHDATGALVASAADPIVAAAVIGGVGGAGWQIKYAGRLVWTEGTEAQPAAESYDFVSQIVEARVQAHAEEAFDKVHGAGEAAKVIAAAAAAKRLLA